MKRKKWFAAAFAAALMFTQFAACSPDGGGTTPPPEQPQPAETVSLQTGFEDDKSVGVIEAGTGVTLSRNTDPQYAHAGSGSLKMSIADFANATFSFSENVEERNISGYDYLSFWVYHTSPEGMFVANSSTYSSTGSYISDQIQPYTWTRVKITSDSDVFGIIQYNVAFNHFIVGPAGSDLGNAVDFDLYLDDIRLYRDGMTGESEIYITDEEGEITEDVPIGAVGKTYTLSSPKTIGPDGFELFGQECEITLTDPDGEPVEVSEDNTFVPSRSGTYVLEYSLTYDGIENSFSTRFEVRFADFEAISMGQAKVGSTYTVPVPRAFEVGTETVNGDVACEYSVQAADGEEIPLSNGTFEADDPGEYIVTYRYSEKYGDVTNTETVERSVWATAFDGLVADFNNGEERMFVSQGANSMELSLAENGRYKLASDDSVRSLKMTSRNTAAPFFRFSDAFPYRDLTGKKYVSFWIYNGSASNLILEWNVASKTIPLTPLSWTRAVFSAEDLYSNAVIPGSEFIMYADENASTNAVNGDFYIDDVRVIGEGDPEELSFAEQLTTNDYDEAAGTGAKIAVNGTYQLALNMSSQDGGAVDATAEVLSIVNRRNQTIQSTDGVFTPNLDGELTITLACEYDGILNSVIKTVRVTPQIEISPNETFVTLPGEAGVEYTFSDLPEVWDKGVVDDAPDFDFYVYDSAGNEVTVTGDSFTPAKNDVYDVIYSVTDPQTKENAILESKIVVYPSGKYGIVADFEDQDVSMMQADCYYYGEIGTFQLATDIVHGGNYSAKVENKSAETREFKFILSENNLAQDISKSTSFSFWIYVSDPNDTEGKNTYKLDKACYDGWVDQFEPDNYNRGSLYQELKPNQWVQIKIERADYEAVLGGTIFAGATAGTEPNRWVVANDDYISHFAVRLVQETPVPENLAIYIDDIIVTY